jgi:hypothetical protein
MRLAVPAFFPMATGGTANPDWPRLANAGNAVSIVVAEQSFPDIALSNPGAKPAINAQFQALRNNGTLLFGYVYARKATPTGTTLRTQAELLNGIPGPPGRIPNPGVNDWYAQYPNLIDGIYFDEAVLAPDAGGAATYPYGPGGALVTAQAFWTDFITTNLRPPTRSGVRVMLLAGQCPDEWVVQVPDYALLWEEETSVYDYSFYPLLNNAPVTIPPWWKNPAYFDKTAHTVRNCPQTRVQTVLELSRERNTGHVFINDFPRAQGYFRLPLYWDDLVWNVNTYHTDPARALSTPRQFLAAYRVGKAQNWLHAWPNGEQATYGGVQVRGTYFLQNDPQIGERRWVRRSDLWTIQGNPGSPTPEVWDIPLLWRAAHYWAQGNGFLTAMPTFEVQTQSGVDYYELLLLRTTNTWLTYTQVPIGQTGEQPTFAEPGFVMRNIHRAAQAAGNLTGWPTFEPDPGPTSPTGRQTIYAAYFVQPGATQVTWADVNATDYLAMVP